MHSSIWAFLLPALLISPAEAAVTITRSPTPPSGPRVLISSPGQDNSGTTSLRYLHPRDAVDEPDKDDPENYIYDGPYNKPRVWYYQRDRDLGQTFTVGMDPIRIHALTLRIGPSANAVGLDAPGAEVFIQLCEVAGYPTINDHGTTGPDGSGDGRYTRWKTFNPADWQTDDYLDGESYKVVNTVQGPLPNTLAANDFLRFAFTGDDAILLSANTAYAWLIGFVSPSAEGGNRAFSLANELFGSYSGGHGLRRDGSTLDLERTFVRDLGNLIDRAESAFAASFPAALTVRQSIPPGTFGFPDVEAYRDYRFYLEGREY